MTIQERCQERGSCSRQREQPQAPELWMSPWIGGRARRGPIPACLQPNPTSARLLGVWGMLSARAGHPWSFSRESGISSGLNAAGEGARRWRDGNRERWKWGEMGTGRGGNRERWKRGEMEIWRDGNMERWKSFNSTSSWLRHRCHHPHVSPSSHLSPHLQGSGSWGHMDPMKGFLGHFLGSEAQQGAGMSLYKTSGSSLFPSPSSARCHRACDEVEGQTPRSSQECQDWECFPLIPPADGSSACLQSPAVTQPLIRSPGAFSSLTRS